VTNKVKVGCHAKTKFNKKSKAARLRETEVIDTKKSKRYVRRDGKGQFRQSVDMGRSLGADRRKSAKTKVSKGRGDQGEVG